MHPFQNHQFSYLHPITMLNINVPRIMFPVTRKTTTLPSTLNTPSTKDKLMQTHDTEHNRTKGSTNTTLGNKEQKDQVQHLTPEQKTQLGRRVSR